MDFNEYCQTKKFDEPIEKNKNQNTSKSHKAEEQALRDKLGKYQNMSQDQLFNELARETTRQKQNGTLNDAKISEMANQIRPLLNSEQQMKLEEIIKMLR